MQIKRALDAPVREAATWEDRWAGPDGGLIACWERGLEKRREDPELAARAVAGELVILPWKGGVEKAIKGVKYGSYQYLAMLQGLCGEPLDIDTGAEVSRVCSRTQMQVIYTNDMSKYVVTAQEGP